MTIVPDAKDWTWVLERPCPECGLDLSGVDPGDVADLIAANTVTWRALLAGDPGDLRRRPREDVWSTLEYACHVRDVHRVFDGRFRQIATTDDPLFDNWDQDATAIADRYGEQDPVTVGAELGVASDALVTTLRAIDADGWQRPARRSDGARFTAATLALYLLHDPVHHLHDVGAGNAS